MTCGNLMTRDPSCCLPGDSVATAAKIMKQQDVGPVLVVSDHSELRLVGIVTDRDIAVKVVAEGRDPYSARVDSVMSSGLITCREDDDVSEAVKLMAEYQVRRVPVVDSNNRVVGIIAQADIARSGQDEQVGELVEDISQPYGSGEWSGGQFERGSGRRSAGLDAGSALAIGALCVGFGAGLMYLFDPNRGRRRRAHLAEKSSELWNHPGQVIQRTTGAITSRFGGPQDQPEADQFTPGPATGSMSR